MTIFEIRDSSLRNPDGSDKLLGFLFYHERTRRFYAEILEGIDEWEAPFMFCAHIEKGRYSIGSSWTMRWVRQRIIPSDRQNIGSILKENGLKYYDEYKLLCLSEGRCAQDEEYIVRTDHDSLPDEIKARFTGKVRDVVPLAGNRVIVFFMDDTSRLIDMNAVFDGRAEFGRIQREREIFNAVRVSPAGFGIEWGEERAIQAEDLYVAGVSLDIGYDDLLSFASNRLVDTTGACDYLKCTRQYVNQLVGQERLDPVLSGDKSRVFLRSQLESM